jgi:divalent metal cation (Fe/Co/Zn/Cd) transporter
MSITAISLLLLTIILKEILGRISQYYGKKIYSSALEADFWHHRTDAISSILVIIAIFASLGGITILDGIVGILIGFFIIYTGIDIARKTGTKLLGTKPSENLLQQVENLALQDQNALAIHDMICHEYGTQMVISFHLEVPSQLKLSEAHTIADIIEKKILNELKIKATVHLDPVLPDVYNNAQIEKLIKSVLSAENAMYEFRDFRLIGEESHATLILELITVDDLTDEKIENLKNILKEKLRRFTPGVKEVQINVISESD